MHTNIWTVQALSCSTGSTVTTNRILPPLLSRGKEATTDTRSSKTKPWGVALLANTKTQDGTELNAYEHDDSLDIHSRRQFMRVTTGIIAGILVADPLPSLAADSSSSSSSSLLQTLLGRLRDVPTFCIVNTQGVPFMAIKQQERMAKGYAFTSMEAAVIVLADAQQAAKEGEYGRDVWKDATIVTIPADIAVRLAIKKRPRMPNRGGATTLDSLLEIIPTIENREDALKIDKRAFMDQGKMPLFFVEQQSATTTSSEAVPLYFRKDMLIQAWLKDHPGEAIPKIQVIELTYLFEAALRGYTDKIPNNGNVIFVPDQEQVEIAQKLKSQGLTMYNLEKMIV